MFTGIIEEVGTVSSFKKNSSGVEIEISCDKILEDISIGDSIAVSGACQTVIKFDKTSFTVQASNETLRCTNFEKFFIGKKVNLERALTLSSRLGGHIVYGHVDTTAKFLDKISDGISDIYKFYVSDENARYLIKKGSVCIDGISLTIADVKDGIFSVFVIPHTSENTTLKYLKNNDYVNIETDIIAKYTEQFMKPDEKTSLSLEFLKENGF